MCVPTIDRASCKKRWRKKNGYNEILKFTWNGWMLEKQRTTEKQTPFRKDSWQMNSLIGEQWVVMPRVDVNKCDGFSINAEPEKKYCLPICTQNDSMAGKSAYSHISHQSNQIWPIIHVHLLYIQSLSFGQYDLQRRIKKIFACFYDLFRSFRVCLIVVVFINYTQMFQIFLRLK